MATKSADTENKATKPTGDKAEGTTEAPPAPENPTDPEHPDNLDARGGSTLKSRALAEQKRQWELGSRHAPGNEDIDAEDDGDTGTE